MKRIAVITGTVITLLAVLVMTGAAANKPTGQSVRAEIQGCQNHISPAGANVKPTWMSWNGNYGGFSAGKFRIANDCGRVNFTSYNPAWRFRPSDCSEARLALRDPETAELHWTNWVNVCPGHTSRLAAGLQLIVNQDVWVEVRTLTASHRNDTNFWYGNASL